ncbi:hypothetical protein [Neobacillus rhizophilus]|uniref:Uncharacterized protein n=1 Tax=Neobacillus rhizophilus TaxID=2833579 RepID=A0A942U8G3_9BACI|nr:hypothetical protein [Neobacillus rhizophilus]MBS4212799.1 hypothetical protein [Neobacillus rhizophilus]
MSAFQGLLKKDFAISKLWFLFWLIFISVFLIIPLAIESYFHAPLSFLPVAVILLLVFNTFLLPCMLLSMLRLEGKTQLWLYNPQSSKALILSKIAVSFVYQLIAQLYLTAVGLVIYQFYKNQIHIEASDLFAGAIIFNIGLLLVGLYVSCWAVFYWTIYHSLGKFPAVKNWRWLVILFLFFLYNLISTFLAKIEILRDVIFKWKIPVLAGPNFNHKEGDNWEIFLNMTDLPVLGLLLYIILACGLFLISCWLLDRKVEV